jgi:hypothetical protein
MLIEWLTVRCATVDGRDIWNDEIAALDTSDEAKQQLLLESARMLRWIDERWNPFIACHAAGDELWRFRSPEGTWFSLAGVAGYAIIREGAIVKTLTTQMS